MTEWIIYYADGSTYSSADGPPSLAPKRGVQVIVQGIEADTDSELLGSFGYYWWDDESGQWLSGDTFGFYDYMCQPGVKIALFGRTLTNQEYQSIRQRAREANFIDS